MPKSDYCSYVLRLWKSQRRGRPVWQAELQNIHTGERRRFTPGALLSFLRTHYGQGDAELPDPPSD
jgi:hypothetical protein